MLLRPGAVDGAAARLDVADLVRAGADGARLVSVRARVHASRGAPRPRRCCAVARPRCGAAGRDARRSRAHPRRRRAPSASRSCVSAERARSLEKEFTARWEREPSAAERSALLAQAAQEEMLYREARVLALGLDDASVRRRLVELMRALGETRGPRRRRAGARGGRARPRRRRRDPPPARREDAPRPAAGPGRPAIRDADLAALLERERARFLQPETITLQQVFVSSDLRGEPAATRAAGTCWPSCARASSPPATRHGAPTPCRFATELRAQPRLKVQGDVRQGASPTRCSRSTPAPGRDRSRRRSGCTWCASSSSRPARLPSVDEVRPALVEALRRERADANLARGLQRLRTLYEVRVADARSASPASASAHPGAR